MPLLQFSNVALPPMLGDGERWLSYRARIPRTPPLKEFILNRHSGLRWLATVTDTPTSTRAPLLHKASSLLLYLLAFYLVSSRLGPVFSKVGESAVSTFELGPLLVAEEDVPAALQVYARLKDVTRAPGPFLLFGRSSSTTSSLRQTEVHSPTTAMGNKSSKKVKSTTEKDPSPQVNHEDIPHTTEPVLEGKSEEPQSVTPVPPEEPGPEKTKEKISETVADFEEEHELQERLTKGLVTADPVSRLKQEERVGSELSLVSEDEGDNSQDSFFIKLAKKAGSRPVKFSKLEGRIATGDLALLYRKDQAMPHLAIFIQNAACDENFPLLLVKGKTKPLPLEKFDPKRMRFVHPVTAATRIFYGDYEKVEIRHLISNSPQEQAPTCSNAMKMVDRVQKIPLSEKEIEAVKNAESPAQRSAVLNTFMAAHYYKLLGIFHGDPKSVRPEEFVTQLSFSDPIVIKLPPVKEGPLKSGDPPFLAKLVEGIRPPEYVKTHPFSSVIDSLDTGDLVLFSGATSSGAIIKFFDHSQFSHVGLVLRTKYTSQVLIWEASTNKAGLVDIDTAKVRKGVEIIPLYHKVFSGWYDRVAIRRLADITADQRHQIYQHLLQFRKEVQGRPYEKSTIELILSSIKVEEGFLSFIRNEQEDISSLFCSEFVAAAYQRAGLLPNDRPSNDYTPDDFSSAKDMKLNFGQLEPEVFIELRFDFAPAYNTQESV